jgi:hypothetical protein
MTPEDMSGYTPDDWQFQHLNAQEYGEQEDDWGGASYAKMKQPKCPA